MFVIVDDCSYECSYMKYENVSFQNKINILGWPSCL